MPNGSSPISKNGISTTGNTPDMGTNKYRTNTNFNEKMIGSSPSQYDKNNSSNSVSINSSKNERTPVRQANESISDVLLNKSRNYIENGNSGSRPVRINKNDNKNGNKTNISSAAREVNYRNSDSNSDIHPKGNILTTSINKNENDFILVNMTSAVKPIKLIIDTGADISLIKINTLNKNVKILDKFKARFSGITETYVESLGIVYCHIIVNNIVIKHAFHVVPENFNIPTDGIFGKDLCKAIKANIDYFSKNISFVKNGKVCSWEMNMGPIRIPPRMEKVVMCRTNSNEPGVCKAKLLQEGLFLGNCLVTPKNGKCVVSVINSTEEEICLPEFIVETENLENYEIFKMSNYEDRINNRLNTLRNGIRTEHMTYEEKNSILEICEDFNDVFHLEGDKLTSTKTLTHKIPLYTDSKPVNIKPYRIPESQKDEVKGQVKKLLDDGIISPSRSPWSSPILIVPKKDDIHGNKKWRLVVDYRKLNEITIGDAFPYPLSVIFLTN